MFRKVRRSPYVSFWVEEGPLFDIAEFLRGEIRASQRPQLFALSPFATAKHPVNPEEVRLLAQLPADSWSDTTDLDLDANRLETLARQGLLVSDSEDPGLADLRRRHDLLAADQWHPYAAFYHFMTRERERSSGIPSVEAPDTEHLAESAAEDAVRFVERYGPPPNPFPRRANPSHVVDLPLIDKAGSFYEVLRRRRSARAFNTSEPMKLADFTALLRYAFGCYGYARQSPDVVLLHKTSPSGGALHPIEAYPLVLNVESLPVGFYHYDVQNHAVEMIQQLELDDARDLAVEICAGQSHAHSAHLMIVMTVRFLRNFWKYRQRSIAYGSVLMEAGHFAQTIQLIAAELGLGIYFAPICDGSRVEEILGLTPQEEGPVAVCGCGIKVTDGPDLGLDFEPFVPRETEP